MRKAMTHRRGGNQTTRRLLTVFVFLCMALPCACTPPEPGTPEAQAGMTAEEILPLIEQGAYEDAMAAIGDSRKLTDDARVTLEQTCWYAQGAEAEAAGDDAAAYGFYEKSAGYSDAQERMAHCRARVAILKARTLFDAYDFDGAFAALDALGDVSEAVEARQAWTAEKPEKLMQLFERARDKVGAGAWYTAALGETPLFAGDARYAPDALPQEADAVYAGVVGMLYEKDGTLTAYGDGFGQKAAVEGLTGVADAAVGVNHVVAALADGTVRTLGGVQNGRSAADAWTGITAVAAGAFHSVGLTGSGACVAAGDNTYGQCDVTGWADVTEVRAGLYHTVGLKADGTCVATGDNTYGQCDVSAWTDVLAVYCGANHTVALTKAFTLLATGANAAGQCEVSAWQDIVAVACGAWHTVGVRTDGQIVFCGADTNGQADVSGWQLFDGMQDDPAPVFVTAEGTADEIVYWGEEVYGPWLYLYRTGVVQIAFDEATEDKILRADLYAAAGSQWYSAVGAGGYLKQPVGAAQLARDNRMVFGITGDYMNVATNPQGIKIRDGEVYSDSEPITGFYLDETGRMIFVDSTALDAQDLLDAGVTDCWTFGPVLLQDGQKLDLSKSHFNNYTALRCVIATAEPYHNIALATGYGFFDGIFLYEAQDILLGYGATDAYNMDGGHSSVFVFMGELLNHSYACADFQRRGIRPLVDMLGFLQSDSVPAADAPYARGNQTVERRK